MQKSIDKEQLLKLKYETIEDMWKVIFNFNQDDLNDYFIDVIDDDDFEEGPTKFKNLLINDIYNELINKLKPLLPTLPMIEAPKIKDNATTNVDDVLLKPIPPKLTPINYETDNFNYLNKLKKEKFLTIDEKLDKLRDENNERKTKRSLIKS